MTLRLQPVIRISRARERFCSACGGGVKAGVYVGADSLIPRAHFLFCRHCARRIGSVGAAIGTRRARPQRKAPTT